MKKMQKFFALFLVLILMINMGTSQLAFASDNTSILDNSTPSDKVTHAEVNPSSDISSDKIITKLYIDDDQTEFLTGSEVSVYAGLELSGNDTFLNGAYMIVSIPKEYLDTSYNSNKGLNVSSGSSLLKTPQVTSDQDFYYIRYEYKDLKGGTLVNLPFVFKTKNYTTPPDSQIILTAKLYDSESREISNKSLTITNKASFKYESIGGSHSFTESRIREGTPTHTSSNPDELDVVYARWGYRNTIYGNSSSLGIYNLSKLKVTVKLAEGVIFDSSFSTENKDWNYDEQNRVLTKVIKSSNSSGYSDGSIYLKMPNVEYDKYHKAFTTEVVVLDDNGKEIESTRSQVSISNVKISRKTVKPPDPPKVPYYHYSLKQNKYYIPQSNGIYGYDYISLNKDKISTWTLMTWNNSKWENTSNNTPKEDIPPKSIFVSEVTDYDLDSHLYYYSVMIDGKNSTLGNKNQLKNNILYGVNSKGEKIEIARNIEVDKEFPISESNHKNKDEVYRSLILSFGTMSSRDGHEIVYTVAEDQLNGYEVSIAGNTESGFIVVNKEVKDITITVDDKTDKKTQNKTNNWRFLSGRNMTYY